MWKQLKRRLRTLHDDTAGAMSVEKILIIALIALPIIIALFIFRKTLIEWFEDKKDELQP